MNPDLQTEVQTAFDEVCSEFDATSWQRKQRLQNELQRFLEDLPEEVTLGELRVAVDEVVTT